MNMYICIHEKTHSGRDVGCKSAGLVMPAMRRCIDPRSSALWTPLGAALALRFASRSARRRNGSGTAVLRRSGDETGHQGAQDTDAPVPPRLGVKAQSLLGSRVGVQRSTGSFNGHSYCKLLVV